MICYSRLPHNCSHMEGYTDDYWMFCRGRLHTSSGLSDHSSPTSSSRLLAHCKLPVNDGSARRAAPYAASAWRDLTTGTPSMRCRMSSQASLAEPPPAVYTCNKLPAHWVHSVKLCFKPFYKTSWLYTDCVYGHVKSGLHIWPHRM